MLNESEMVPYRRLVCSIIIQAVTDYQEEMKKSGRSDADVSRIGRWFLQPDPTNRANFANLCDLLNKKPEHLLQRLGTRDLLREMRTYQAALEKRYQRYIAEVDGAQWAGA